MQTGVSIHWTEFISFFGQVSVFIYLNLEAYVATSFQNNYGLWVVSNHWTGLLDWNTGLDYWTGLFFHFMHFKSILARSWG